MLRKQALFFQQSLLFWHRHYNKRELPWKGEKDVYRIWLSEIILQQTRAEQGWKYYERFLKAYPTISKLADAPLTEVVKLWEGLGYYNRCRNLHATAQKVTFEMNGQFPDTYEGILNLKGIGPYTAAAISSFAYNLPYAVVDGNVLRVLSRFFGEAAPIDSTKGRKVFEHLAKECLAKDKAAVYNQAIMDFGATVCKPDNPLCNQCSLQAGCTAFKQKTVLQLPVKEKSLLQRSRWFVFFAMAYKNSIAVEKRRSRDVWQDLYQFPLMEFRTEKEWKAFIKSDIVNKQKLFHSASLQLLTISKPVVQKLSHQTIYAVAVAGKLNKKEKTALLEWKTKEKLTELPFPRVIHQLIKGKLLDVF